MFRVLAFIGVLSLCSCAAKPGAGPSLNKLGAKISNAQRYNDLALSGSQRIDAKAAVILKYWDAAK